MLSLTRVSSGQAGTYYKADDYYLKESGEWQGRLAKKLGYSVAIKEEDFQNLIKGTDPHRQFQIQSGGREHSHTAGVDLTFSAPKSVSITGLVFDDKRILLAHDKAVSDTLAYIEKNYAKVRIKENHQVHSQVTNNLLVAKFQHVTSRELDPQLHTHCLVMNLTQKKNGEIRACDYRDIYENKLLIGQIYRSELAANLKELGYQIKTDSRGLFEIEGINSELIKEFSTRSKQIKAKADELKRELPSANVSKLKEFATLDSRQTKQEVGINNLKQDWDTRINRLSINKQALIPSLWQPSLTQGVNALVEVEEIVKNALAIATEHEAVVQKEEILRIATKLSQGEYRVAAIETALAKNSDVIRLNGKDYTTQEIANIERKIISTVKSGQRTLPTILGNETIKIEIARYELEHGFNLSAGQKAAVNHILTSQDRVIAIQGDAGTGKTTMLDVVRTIGEKEGQSLVGLSFTGKAAGEIEEASKIKSGTIASLLQGSESLKGQLVVVDEASMLSIKDLNALLKRCEADTRLVLIGDTKQLQTIGQGKIFSSLQEKQAINIVRMSEVQRQNDPQYKEVVDLLGARRIDEAFNKLSLRNKIYEINGHNERLKSITQEFLKNPHSTIIVTASNKDREELNKLIRDELLAGGKIKAGGVILLTRETKNLQAEEKSFGQSYSVGDLVVANKAGILGRAGNEARIVGVDEANHLLQLKSADKTYVLDLMQNGRDLQIYTENTKPFAQGDKILFLKNDKSLSLKNGQSGYIKSIREDGTLTVKLDNEKELSFNPQSQYNYLSHGYALTDYKSQGQTEKHVIYHADTDRVVNFNQAYVAITRGKNDVKIYTNDKAKLLENMKNEQCKTTTLDHDLTTVKIGSMEKLNVLDRKITAVNSPDEIMKVTTKVQQPVLEEAQFEDTRQQHEESELER